MTNKYTRGDLVSIDGSIRTVVSVTARKIGYHIKEKECRMHYVRLQDISPIPVSPEILELFGFKSDRCPYVLRYTLGDIAVAYVQNRIQVSVSDIACCPVYYIHQLQQFVHIVTGLELKADLSKI